MVIIAIPQLDSRFKMLLEAGLRNMEHREERKREGRGEGREGEREMAYYSTASKEPDIGAGHGRKQTQRRQHVAVAAATATATAVSSFRYSAFLRRFWFGGVLSRVADCELGLPRYPGLQETNLAPCNCSSPPPPSVCDP